MKRNPVVLLCLALSCGGGKVPGTADDTGSAGTATGDCAPGTESCSCTDSSDGQCIGDLVCLSDVCVKLPDADESGAPPEPPPPDTDDGATADDGADGPGATGTSAGGVDCSEAIGIPCDDPEMVCIETECSHAWDHTWEMRVTRFQTVTCGELFGDLDPDYLVWRGDDENRRPNGRRME